MRYVLIVLFIILLACGGSQTVKPTLPKSYQVTYRIEGTAFAKASLTYQNASGATQQEDVEIPWSTAFTASAGQFVYLSGQLDGDGTIRCQILIDGKPFKEAESKGKFVISTCNGALP